MKQLKTTFPLVATFSLIALVSIACFWFSDVQATFDGDINVNQSSNL